jgi:hypothetical protein
MMVARFAITDTGNISKERSGPGAAAEFALSGFMVPTRMKMRREKGALLNDSDPHGSRRAGRRLADRQ